jgi:lysophospholipase L1-like esterase
VSFKRYVALGDSFTEGVGDPDPSRPNGLRGWADRVAEVLAGQVDGFGYANLAIRGRKLDQIIDEQLEPALALEPDLVTVYAGANDILRPAVDIDRLVKRYADAVGRLRENGATVVVWTGFDPGGSKVFALTRGRFAVYSEMVREIADEHGATLVDYWRMREFRDWRDWDAARMHMSPAGHQKMAIRVLETLGVRHAIDEPTLPDVPAPGRRDAARANAEWVREHAVPWVQRRLTGRSSGDDVLPKRPVLGPMD